MLVYPQHVEATPVPCFPQVIYAPPGGTVADLHALLQREHDLLRRRLLQVGAILFRGFSVATPADAESLVQAGGGAPMRYMGGDSPRKKVGEFVYSSTEAPSAIGIPLHNELSYLDAHPRTLWFACATPAVQGGETTIADGRAILRDLLPAVRERFVKTGVRYRLCYRGPYGLLAHLDPKERLHKSWMQAFETEDRKLVEEHCERMGAEYHWLANGSLVVETSRPATIRHPESGAQAWFNQAHLFRLSARYLGRLRFELARVLFAQTEMRSHHASFGDGREIDEDTLEHLFDVLDAHSVRVPWQRGDVLWLDNFICLHGRRPFRGERRVWVAMSQ